MGLTLAALLLVVSPIFTFAPTTLHLKIKAPVEAQEYCLYWEHWVEGELMSENMSCQSTSSYTIWRELRIEGWNWGDYYFYLIAGGQKTPDIHVRILKPAGIP